MYYFIVNPNSRSGKGGILWNTLQEELDRRSIAYEYYMTEYVGHDQKLAAKITANASADHPVHLIAMGGDGTVSGVLSGIRNPDYITFGFIPSGSGNDFCRSMHIPGDPIQALDCILKEEKICHLDIPEITYGKNALKFGISAGMGFDAAVCQEVASAPAKRVLNKIGLGKLVYVVIALKQILTMSPEPMRICLDKDRILSFEKVYFCAAMNQPYEGGGFKFCPDALPDDGLLDLIVVEGLSKWKLLFCLPTAFSGKHTRFKGIHILRCKEVEMTSAVPLSIHADGEPLGRQNKIFIKFEKNSLKIVTSVL
ncbi:MAG: diacylglycerol kinase family lipid kinase [Blautia sp.]|nr:diacylglycerol kinase family lipid kinase [Blautia sp.]